MASAGYSEIPGVYSESPRPLASLRRTLRNYKNCIAISFLLALVLGLATGISVLIVKNLDDGASHGDDLDPAQTPSNLSLVTLMSLPWPRRDESWYIRRWQRTAMRTPDDPDKPQFPDDDPDHPDDPDHNPDSPEWIQPDNSTYPDGDTWTWNRRPDQLPRWSGEDVSTSLSEGSQEEMKKTEVEEELAKRNVSLRRGSASYRHQEGFRKTDPLATNMSRLGYAMDRASCSMSRRMNITRETSAFDSRWIGDLSSSPYCDQERLRPRPSPCSPSHPYRSVDGTCNNLDNPDWGASFTPFRRAMPPEYGDGLSSLRRAKDGGDLPSAREVSNGVHINRMVDSQSYSVLTMSWGQFVDHDVTLTAQTKGSGGRSIACCPDLVKGDPRLSHPECAPISIPQDDPFYGPFNQTCMEFVRSAPAPKCQFGPRDQINQQTGFLDGSAVYGYTPQQLASLRTMSDGLLRSQVTLDGRELMPPSMNPEDGCNKEEEYKYDRFCFLAGDPRANEQILLTIFHTIWARQHNLLALSLKDLNPMWDDERLFQEARRIVIAQIQHITYHEYVPSIIGPKLMKHLKLSPQSGGTFTQDYNPKLHPGIANEFAAAAYRFGHSQIQGLVQKIDAPEKNVDFHQLSSITFNPFSLYDPGMMDKYVRGEASQHTGAVDTYFSSQVTGKLFRGEEKFGIDLVAINLQRGRDHGVGGYLRARMYCGLPPHANFTHLTTDMDAGALASIQQVYRHVEDIDLYTGGLAERPVESGLVGPTFACILADQFLRLKRGDRFWYETDLKPQAFTEDQLEELHKTSLARIICDNVPEMGSIQRWPLRTYATGNPRLPCTSGSIPRVDLGPWEEGEI